VPDKTRARERFFSDYNGVGDIKIFNACPLFST